MKKLRSFCVLLLLCAASALAVDFTALQPQGYVSDFANVVDAASRQQLEQYSANLKNATGVELAFVTLPNLAGEPVEDVANALFRKWGIGQKGQNNGILLLLSIQDRRSRLEIGYGLEPAITDGMAGDVLRAMRPYLRAGRYGDALIGAANEIGTRISQAKDVPGIAPPPQPRQRRPREGPLPFGVVVGGIIVFFVLSSLLGGRGGRRPGGLGGFVTGMILGNLLGGGRSWNSHRGGGFGGFDSGGFGGFGGGDSGGGGASSSW